MNTAMPIACNLHAFDDAQLSRYHPLVQQLAGAVESVTEREDGFTFTLSSDAATCLVAMEFATLERRCCTFLTFALQLAPQNGPLTLTLTGPDGAKEVLADFVSRLSPSRPPQGT